MKKYFTLNGKEQKGPYTIEELKKMELTDKYSIWSEGYEDWVNVREVEELKQQVIITPPPTPKQVKTIKNKKAFVKAINTTGISFVVLFIWFFLIFGGFAGDEYLLDKYDSYTSPYRIYGGISSIRSTILTFSFLVSVVVSILIFIFSYRSKLKNSNPNKNENLKVK